jgi:hypothetical protein
MDANIRVENADQKLNEYIILMKRVIMMMLIHVENIQIDANHLNQETEAVIHFRTENYIFLMENIQFHLPDF